MCRSTVGGRSCETWWRCAAVFSTLSAASSSGSFPVWHVWFTPGYKLYLLFFAALDLASDVDTCLEMRKIIFSSIADPKCGRLFQQCCGSGSVLFGSPGSFYHQTKIIRKTLISTILWLFYDFLSLKNDVNAPVFRSLIQIRIHMFLVLLDPHSDLFVRCGCGCGCGSSDPYQNVTDPQHRFPAEIC